MAISDIVTPSRELLRVGDVAYKRAVSEAILTRVAAMNNHIALKQWLTLEYKLNGYYEFAENLSNLDGMFIFPVDCEIGYISFSNAVAGASGASVLDVDWFSDSGVNEGTIFSTKPAISSAGPNNAYVVYDTINSSVIGGGGAGITNPALSKSTFLAGEAVAVNLDSSMTGAENLNLTIYFRPT